MPCTEPDHPLDPLQQALRRSVTGTLALGAVGFTGGWLVGCSAPTPPVKPVLAGPVATPPPRREEPAAPPPDPPAAHWSDYQLRAAHKLVKANPGRVYLGPPPEPLLAIPVIEVELKADGHIAKLVVLRKPGQAQDTVELALDALKRAAPFGDVRHLPKPWKFVEVFLFNDDRLFKPRTLDA